MTLMMEFILSFMYFFQFLHRFIECQFIESSKISIIEIKTLMLEENYNGNKENKSK